MPDPIRILLFGAGNRGEGAYGHYALQHPEEVQFVAVADPNPTRRSRLAEAHHIPREHQFKGWQEALNAGRIADAVINATQDQMHHESALAALDAGYDMLLEKPIAPTLQETVEIVRKAESSERLLMICHVLRYTDFFQKVNQIVKSGRLGQVVHISHSENVSYFHMAHSYVRGNWRNKDLSALMILAKCCHDLDLLYWFLGEKVASLSSSGGLRHFRTENAPPDAPKRCTDGCPAADACPYFAPRIYIENYPIKKAVSESHNPILRWIGKSSLRTPKLMRMVGKLIPPVRMLTEYSGWPRNTIIENPESDRAVLDALRLGPYGRCVYHCDNNVVDHQVVDLTFKSGITATLTMHGHSHEEGRSLRIDGSQATLLGKFTYSQAWLEVHDHALAPTEHYKFPSEVDQTAGHGGGDAGLMYQFVQALRGEHLPLTSARDSLESHLMAFAADRARRERTVIDMNAFREQ